LLGIEKYNKVIREEREIAQERGHMETEQITIHVDAEAAKAFKSASSVC
jgi:hypothetical protein